MDAAVQDLTLGVFASQTNFPLSNLRGDEVVNLC